MADVAYATPILKAVRELHPDAHITWCIRDKFAPVIRNNPHLDAVKEYTLPNGYKTRQEAEYVMWRQMKDEAELLFDKVIKPQQWPDHNFWRSNLDLISLMAENAGLDATAITDRRIVLEVSQEEERNAVKFIRDYIDRDDYGWASKFITVNHISYAASPVWSFENYSRLVSILDEKGIKCIFTGAPSEPIPKGVIDARGMPYMEWAEVINNSNLFLGLDSGAKALAAATETPMILLQSRDFNLQKTGCKAMGIRTENIWELTTPPNPESLADLIIQNIGD